MFLQPIPDHLKQAPFFEILQFARQNGLGKPIPRKEEDQSLRWSTKTLVSAVTAAAGGLDESTFNQWANGTNQPSSLSGKFFHVLIVGEVAGWQELFLESLTRNNEPKARKRLYDAWKKRSSAAATNRQTSPAYASFIEDFTRAEAVNREQRAHDLVEQEESLRRQSNFLRDDVRAALDQASALRAAGDLIGAQALLARIEASRLDDMDLAQQIQEGGARIAQERGRLAYDLGLSSLTDKGHHHFLAALGHYGRALHVTPIGQSAEADRIRRLMARALHEAIRSAPDFDTGFDLISAHLRDGVAKDRSPWHSLMLLAPDLLAALLVLRQMPRAGVAPDVASWSIAMLAAKDFAEGMTVLDMMGKARPEPIRPNVITSFALASKIADQEDARTAVELMQPYNLAGKEFLRALAVSLAQHHSADVVLDWANLFCEIFSVPGYYTDAFNTAMKSYRTRGKKSDVLRIAMAYPHLPEASLAMTLWKDEALAFFETFLNDDLGAVALHAIARVHNYNGDPDLARLWAQRTIQHPQYAAFHPNRQADVVGLAN